jgi:hypothetical protein
MWHPVILNSFRHHMYTGPNSIEVLQLQFPMLVEKCSFLSGTCAPEAGVMVNLVCVCHGMKELGKTGSLLPCDWGNYDVLCLCKVKKHLAMFRDTFMVAFNQEAS